MHPELKHQLYGGEVSDYYKNSPREQKSQGVDQDYKDLYNIYKNNVSNNIKNYLDINLYK